MREEINLSINNIEMEEKKKDQTDEEVSKIWWEKHLKR